MGARRARSRRVSRCEPERSLPRPAQARRCGAGLGRQPPARSARRTRRRTRHRREPGTRWPIAVVPRPRHHRVPHRPRHGPRAQRVRPHLRARLRPDHRGGNARRDPIAPRGDQGVSRRAGHRAPRDRRPRCPNGGRGPAVTTEADALAPAPDGPSAQGIEIVGMSAGYGGVAVVRDLNIHVRPGEVVALLGPNGAGQDDHTAHDLRSDQAAGGFGLDRRRKRRHPVPAQECPARAGTRRRGPVLVLPAHRRGEPEARAAWPRRSEGGSARRRVGDAAGTRAIDGPASGSAVGRRATDARHGAGACVSPEAVARRRDEPRAGADHRRAVASDRARCRIAVRRRRADRRAACPHGARGRRPGLRDEPRSPVDAGHRRRTQGEPGSPARQLHGQRRARRRLIQRGTSFQGPASARGSLGRPRTRSPRMLRCTSSEPPAIRYPGAPSTCSPHPYVPHSPESAISLGPSTPEITSVSLLMFSVHMILPSEPSGPGVPERAKSAARRLVNDSTR